MIEGGGAHKPYIAGVREPGVTAQLAQSVVTVAAFEHDVLQETFTGDTQELVDDNFKLAVKKYTQATRLEVILGTMETRPWEEMPETWADMQCTVMGSETGTAIGRLWRRSRTRF